MMALAKNGADRGAIICLEEYRGNSAIKTGPYCSSLQWAVLTFKASCIVVKVVWVVAVGWEDPK